VWGLMKLMWTVHFMLWMDTFISGPRIYIMLQCNTCGVAPADARGFFKCAA
jgi:hypothetical protein